MNILSEKFSILFGILLFSYQTVYAEVINVDPCKELSFEIGNISKKREEAFQQQMKRIKAIENPIKRIDSLKKELERELNWKNSNFSDKYDKLRQCGSEEFSRVSVMFIRKPRAAWQIAQNSEAKFRSDIFKRRNKERIKQYQVIIAMSQKREKELNKVITAENKKYDYSQQTISRKAMQRYNIRSGPGTSYKVIGHTQPGESYNVLVGEEERQDWVAIYRNLRVIYVHSDAFKSPEGLVSSLENTVSLEEEFRKELDRIENDSEPPD